MCLIDDGSKEEVNLLISYRNGIILDLNDNFKEVNYKDSDIYKMYKMYLDNSDRMQDRLFNS